MSNFNFVILLLTTIICTIDSSNVTENSSLVNVCGSNKFQCKSGQCVDESNVCDYYPDCSDASDENDCGWCDFSTGLLCGWNKTDNLKYSCDNRGHPGKCFLVETCCSCKTNFNFTLTSPILRKTSKNCEIKFSYFTYNSNNFQYPDVIVDRLFNNYKIKISTLKTKRDTNALGTINIGYIPAEPESRLLLNFLQVTFACGVAGIGNITFENCLPKKIPINCDFEENLNCTWWFIVNRYAGKWKWHSDGYIYTDQKNLAEIRSPLIEPNIGEEGACLSFQYLNNGTKGTLHLSRMNLGKDQDESVIWSANDLTHDIWKKVKLFIKTSVDIDIGFLGKSVNGIMAIDNIKYKKGPCYDFAETTTTSLIETQTTRGANFNELSCTFETIEERKRLCSFVKVQKSCHIKAEVVSKKQGYFGKGPKTDHTLSTKEGWFLNFNQNSTRCNDSLQGVEEIRFIYPKIRGSSSPRCLHFWYQLSSDQVSLSVIVGTNQSVESRLWHVSREVTKWKLAAIRLDAEFPYDITFLVRINDFNPDSFVAIDDIMIEQGEECNLKYFDLIK